MFGCILFLAEITVFCQACIPEKGAYCNEVPKGKWMVFRKQQGGYPERGHIAMQVSRQLQGYQHVWVFP